VFPVTAYEARLDLITQGIEDLKLANDYYDKISKKLRELKRQLEGVSKANPSEKAQSQRAKQLNSEITETTELHKRAGREIIRIKEKNNKLSFNREKARQEILIRTEQRRANAAESSFKSTQKNLSLESEAAKRLSDQMAKARARFGGFVDKEDLSLMRAQRSEMQGLAKEMSELLKTRQALSREQNQPFREIGLYRTRKRTIDTRMRGLEKYTSRVEADGQTKGVPYYRQIRDLQAEYADIQKQYTNATKKGQADVNALRQVNTRMGTLFSNVRSMNSTLKGNTRDTFNPGAGEFKLEMQREEIDLLNKRAQAIGGNVKAEKLLRYARNNISSIRETGVIDPTANPELGSQQLKKAKRLIEQQERLFSAEQRRQKAFAKKYTPERVQYLESFATGRALPAFGQSTFKGKTFDLTSGVLAGGGARDPRRRGVSTEVVGVPRVDDFNTKSFRGDYNKYTKDRIAQAKLEQKSSNATLKAEYEYRSSLARLTNEVNIRAQRARAQAADWGTSVLAGVESIQGNPFRPGLPAAGQTSFKGKVRQLADGTVVGGGAIPRRSTAGIGAERVGVLNTSSSLPLSLAADKALVDRRLKIEAEVSRQEARERRRQQRQEEVGRERARRKAAADSKASAARTKRYNKKVKADSARFDANQSRDQGFENNRNKAIRDRVLLLEKLSALEAENIPVAATKLKIEGDLVDLKSRTTKFATLDKKRDDAKLMSLKEETRLLERQLKLRASGQAAARGSGDELAGPDKFFGKEGRAESLALGVGFPLLFGAGPGSLAGSFVGTFFGPGFGGQILGGAVGQLFDSFATAAAATGAALNKPTENLELLAQAGIFSSKNLEFAAKELLAAGKSSEAIALIRQESEKLIGAAGARDMRNLGRESERMGKELARLGTQLQALAAGPLASAAATIANVIEQLRKIPGIGPREFSASDGQFLSGSAKAELNFIRGTAALFGSTIPGAGQATSLLQDQFTQGLFRRNRGAIESGRAAQEAARPLSAEEAARVADDQIRAATEAKDRQREAEDIRRQGIQLQRDADATSLQLTRSAMDLEMRVIDLRRSVEDRIFSQRQRAVEQEIQVFTAQTQIASGRTQLRFLQLASGQTQEGREYLQLAEQFIAIRRNGEVQIQTAERQFKIEMTSMEKDSSDYSFNLERQKGEIKRSTADHQRSVSDAIYSQSIAVEDYKRRIADYQVAQAQRMYELAKQSGDALAIASNGNAASVAMFPGGTTGGAYLQGNIGPGSTGPHFDVRTYPTYGGWFERNALDPYAKVNGRPLSSGTTRRGGEFGADRARGRGAHRAWDYAFGDGRHALTLTGGAKWVKVKRGTANGDSAVLQTPDGKMYEIIHGKFEGNIPPSGKPGGGRGGNAGTMSAAAAAATTANAVSASPAIPKPPGGITAPGAPAVPNLSGLQAELATIDARLASGRTKLLNLTKQLAEIQAEAQQKELKNSFLQPDRDNLENLRRRNELLDVSVKTSTLFNEYGARQVELEAELGQRVRIHEEARKDAVSAVMAEIQANKGNQAEIDRLTKGLERLNKLYDEKGKLIRKVGEEAGKSAEKEMMAGFNSRLRDIRRQNAYFGRGIKAGYTGQAANVYDEAIAQYGESGARQMADAQAGLQGRQQTFSDVQNLSGTISEGVKRGMIAAVAGGNIQEILASTLSSLGGALVDIGFRPIEEALTRQLFGLLDKGGEAAALASETSNTVALTSNTAAVVANTVALGTASVGSAVETGIIDLGLGALGAFGGAFADGGNPPLGKVSIVGERGRPEFFIPKTSGTIIPAEKLFVPSPSSGSPQQSQSGDSLYARTAAAKNTPDLAKMPAIETIRVGQYGDMVTVTQMRRYVEARQSAIMAKRARQVRSMPSARIAMGI
jgi:hypothetical protein